MKILLVEDDQTTQQFVSKGFREEGHVVDTADNGPDGLHLATSGEYDLIILDRMLPQIDGLTILSVLRTQGSVTPVIILSALSHVDERIKGLKSGGDDYITKPFSFHELLLRRNLLMKRTQQPADRNTTLKLDNLVMDLIGRRVERNGKEIKLQPKEFQLLRYLLEHAGQVVSRTMLFEAVWDYHFDPKTNVIDVHVAKLRRKLEEDDQSQLIHTVRGTGYVARTP
jgi:two-component system OmpR family response regulator